MTNPSDDQYSEEEELVFEHHSVTVDSGQEKLRLDKFLMDRLPNITRNKLQLAIKAGFVTINKEEVKPNYRVRPGDEVSVSFPEPVRQNEILPEDIPLTIPFEDDHLLIVNKKPGMVVHPGYNNYSGTLVHALTHHFQNLPTSQNGEQRPGLVHRIDKDTSGLLVIAKTEDAMTGLAKQFYDHSIERTYHALVWGMPKEEQGTIEGHIGRSLKDRRVMSVFPDGDFGKEAITHYKVLESFHYVTLVECKLETGRTHQIRAHMKYLGHPLFNDATYGGDKILKGEKFTKYKQFVENNFKFCPRQALHAKTLGFLHPVTGKQLFFESETPEDISHIVERWRKYIDQREVI
jgi:23S rRNA pseudouridine1911/1915/1917 synthase